MEQPSKNGVDVRFVENLNAQRIERLSESVTALRDTIGDFVSRFAASLATQAQTLAGFRELYAREIGFIHKALDDVKTSLDYLKAVILQDKDKITEVEKDIAVARGSVKSVIMTWSGFVALVAFLADKIVELMLRK